jgi:hypothetical protein
MKTPGQIFFPKIRTAAIEKPSAANIPIVMIKLLSMTAILSLPDIK